MVREPQRKENSFRDGKEALGSIVNKEERVTEGSWLQSAGQSVA